MVAAVSYSLSHALFDSLHSLTHLSRSTRPHPPTPFRFPFHSFLYGRREPLPPLHDIDRFLTDDAIANEYRYLVPGNMDPPQREDHKVQPRRRQTMRLDVILLVLPRLSQRLQSLCIRVSAPHPSFPYPTHTAVVTAGSHAPGPRPIKECVARLLRPNKIIWRPQKAKNASADLDLSLFSVARVAKPQTLTHFTGSAHFYDALHVR